MDALDPREQVALLKEELAKKEALIELAALKVATSELLQCSFESLPIRCSHVCMRAAGSQLDTCLLVEPLP